jgi:hypothetical protein
VPVHEWLVDLNTLSLAAFQILINLHDRFPNLLDAIAYNGDLKIKLNAGQFKNLKNCCGPHVIFKSRMLTVLFKVSKILGILIIIITIRRNFIVFRMVFISSSASMYVVRLPIRSRYKIQGGRSSGFPEFLPLFFF